MVIFFNLALFGLAAALGGQLLYRYRTRPRSHTLWYAVGLLLTAVAALPNVVVELTGGLPAPLWWLYWVSASATVGYLGTGTAFLISERFGKDVLMLVSTLTIALFLTAVLTSPRVPEVIDLTSSPTPQIRVFFLTQNIAGSALIIGGAAYSFFRTRLTYNLLIIVGTLIFASGGRLDGSALFMTKAVGMLVLYFGVAQSLTAFRPKAVQAAATEPLPPVGVSEPLSLRQLQEKIKQQGRHPRQTEAAFLQLVGGVGQLAEALRQDEYAASPGVRTAKTQEELYEVMCSVLAVANAQDIDLEECFRSKERSGQVKREAASH